MILMEVLEAAGVEIHQATSKNEIYICCPFCTDNRYRLGINISTGAAHCFNCEWKSRSVMHTARQLCQAFGMKFSSHLAVKERREQKEHKAAKRPVTTVLAGLPKEYETFKNCDEIGDKARDYLERRRVSALQIVKHRIGFAAAGEMAWRILFPIVDEKGAVHGCVGRGFFTGEQQTPKYLNTPGIKLLWNAHRPATEAVVVEGVMDALRIESALLQRRDSIALARLGSSITQHQLDQLKKYERVVVFPDFDRAGIHGALELCRLCETRGIQTSVVIPHCMTGEDPGDMDENRIIDELKGAVRWSVTTDKRLRLAATRESDDD